MNETPLEQELSEPTAELVEALQRVPGDLLILGAGGKMGPSLARLAVRGNLAAGTTRRVIALSRFPDPLMRQTLERDGVETIAGDLLDRTLVDSLPEAPNVIFMAGRKFGTTTDASATWVTNTWLPGAVVQRFPRARIVAFSTGNVYPVTAVTAAGPAETDSTGPSGEYAWSALAREQVLQFFSRRHGTPMAIMRLNYAVEPRYGVLRDLADRVMARQPIDVSPTAVNLIWQRDANAIALRLLEHCQSPPLVLNVTGRPAVTVRYIGAELARRLEVPLTYCGMEREMALLADAARCEQIFGPAPTDIATMLDRVAGWVRAGGRSLDRPTHFDQLDGQF